MDSEMSWREPGDEGAPAAAPAVGTPAAGSQGHCAQAAPAAGTPAAGSQVHCAQAEPAGGERSFTQEDVNEIVQKRLQREREKWKAPDSVERQLIQRENDVLRRELKLSAKERLQDAGLPVAAAELLRYDDEAGFEESFAALRDLLGPQMQKAVQEMFRAAGRTPPRGSEPHRAKDDALKAAFLPKQER